MRGDFWDRLYSALSSELVVGIVLGLILSLLSAFAIEQIQRRRFVKNTKALCLDLIESVSAYVIEFEEGRRKSGVIERDYIHLIDVEVAVYDRTREHFSVNLPPDLRKDVREFFTRITSTSARIKNHLQQFDTHYINATNAADAENRVGHDKEAKYHLDRAHEQCAHLSSIRSERSSILMQTLRS